MYELEDAFNPQSFNFYVIQNIDNTINAGDFLCSNDQYLYPDSSVGNLGISKEYLQDKIGAVSKIRKITDKNSVVYYHPLICPLSGMRHDGYNQYL